MKLMFRGAIMASLFATPALANEPSTDLEKLSYSLGIILGERIQNDFGELDPQFVLEGLKDSKDPNSWKLDRPAINKAVQDAQTKVRAEQQRQVEAMSEANLKSGEVFLTDNAKQDGVTVTASGLQYKVLAEGSGDSPKATDTVKVHYEGRLISGDIFDSSIARGEPVSFPLNGVIPGWSEGVQLMKVGSKFQFTIPSALAYGPAGTGPIPPNSVLVFDVELLEINPAN
jgi:FKBP-type peptidyl-prolyl cis-trans isomerase FklB